MRRLVEVDFLSGINKSEKGDKLKNGGRKKQEKGEKRGGNKLNAGLRGEVAEAGRGRFFSGIVKSEKREKTTGNGKREKKTEKWREENGEK